MKITQYTTTENITLHQFDIQPIGDKMGNAEVIEFTDKEITEVIGFGCSLTSSSCYILDKMDEKQRKEFLQNVYGKDGLDLSVARIPVGSCDYSPYVYTYDDVENDTTLSHFSIERDQEFVIPMIKEVLAIKPDLYTYSSPWSPPGWMKTGGSICGGHMRRKYIETYADYYVKFLQEYKKNGIGFNALTPQNEVETDQGGKMPACYWHPEIEAEFVLALSKKLKENGLDTKIWLNDHAYNLTPRVMWMLKEYPDLVKALDGVAFHYYGGNAELTQIIPQTYPSLSLQFTEGGPRLYDDYAIDWCKWAMVMNSTLNSGYQSFSGWNLILDENGGPNVGPFFCGGLATYNTTTHELSYSGQYKAFNHYSRFIKKGAKVLESKVVGTGYFLAGFNRNKAEILPSVAVVKNPDGSIVLQIANANPNKRQFQFKLDGKWYYVESLPNSLVTVEIKK